MLRDGDLLRLRATHGVTSEVVLYVDEHPFHLNRGSATGRAALEGQAIHIPDVLADPDYRATGLSELLGYRTSLGVPLLRSGAVIGVFALTRREVSPFAENQIELVTTFAAQAVIAIENARLLSELREALEQQTAASNVLQVISSSPGNLEPVFATMLENAVRLCDAKFGTINRWDGEALHLVATHKVPPAFAEFRKRTPFRPGPDNPISRMLMTKSLLHFEDLTTERDYLERNPIVAAVELAGARTVLVVPMLKENELVGALLFARQEVRAFSEKQIELTQSFAAQAVIAIENARLLNELRQRTNDLTERTADLTEALEQQTATSDVLEVISRSAFDLQAVFETVAESSVRLCGADRAFIFRFDGEFLRMVVAFNSSPEFKEWVAQHPIRPGRHSAAARAALERGTVHIPDVLADPEFTYGAKDVEAIRNGTRGADPQRRRLAWCHDHLSPARCQAVFGQTDRACRDLRRSGGDCD